MSSGPKYLMAAMLVVGLTAAGCTSAPSSSNSSGSSNGLKTGNGITDSTINILSITDLSGPAAAGGKPVQAGFDAYIKHLNDSGGIDGRQVKVQVADTQYNPQQAVQAFQGAKDNIAAVLSYGTPTTDAIRPFAANDHLLLVGLKGPFAEDNTFSQGTAFEVDTANIVTYVAQKHPDAKIGAIYQSDALGDGVKRGVQEAVKETGVKLVAEATADATSKDLTAQVTTMRKAGADYVVLGLAPGATIAAVGAVSALGYGATLLSPGTAYSPTLLNLPVGPTMTKQMLITCSYPQWDQDSAGNKEFKAALPAGTQPNSILVLGWISGIMMKSFIEQAFKDGDATPAGIVKAAQHSTVDTNGLTPTMHFGTDINQRTPFRESQVCSVGKDSDDGVTLLKSWFESDAAKNVKLQ